VSDVLCRHRYRPLKFDGYYHFSQFAIIFTSHNQNLHCHFFILPDNGGLHNYFCTTVFHNFIQLRLNNTYIELLRMMFDYCLTIGLIRTNPIKEIRLYINQFGVIRAHMQAKAVSIEDEKLIYNRVK